MTVCRFWSNGNCRNGDSCKFEHPGAGSNRISSNDRYNALQGPSNSRDDRRKNPPPYIGLDKENLIKDLSTERPEWILSCFGPGRNAPEQLFGGPLREHSFEEMRLEHYMAPNPQQKAQEVQNLVVDCERQIQSALNDLDGAIDFIVSAKNKHPNRCDLVEAVNAKGKVEDPANPFGQPSTLGVTPNPFGAGGSTFGQPSALGGAGAFGQPSALGQNPNPFAAAASTPFGQAPAFTNAAPSGFATFANAAPSGISTGGNTANPFAQNSAPAFGQPSLTSAPLNAPTMPSAMNPNPFAAARPNSTFGQPSLPAPSTNNANPFSSTSNAIPFGQPPATQQSTFGQPSQPSTFGQPSAFGQPSGACGFGQPSQPSAFGQPSGAGGFGQPSQPSAFGQPSGAGAFGQPSTGAGGGGGGIFGQPSLPSNPLTSGIPGNNANSLSPTSSNQMTNPYGPRAKHTHPHISTYTTRASNPLNPSQPPQLTSFKNHPVRYNTDIKAYEYNLQNQIQRVIFPDGPPNFYAATEEKDEVYDNDEGMKAVWERFRERWLRDGGVEGLVTGMDVGFEGAVVPWMAPKREWCLWDF